MCKFRLRVIFDQGPGGITGDEVFDYFSVKNGLLLYQETGMGPVTELTGATINGSKVF